jgi:transposase
MVWAGEQFRWTLVDPLGPAAALEAMVIQEEPQQVQIPVAQAPAEKKWFRATAFGSHNNMGSVSVHSRCYRPYPPTSVATCQEDLVALQSGRWNTAAQIFLRLREAGYGGGATIVKDYVRQIRPPRTPAFLTLSFAPGECAQIDWGQFGSVNVGNTRRRLSFFVMVLCYSRMLYVEFTVSETMEHFLACHANAFAFFGGVPAKAMIDNLRSAVLQRVIGQDPVFHPRYKDCADHYGFAIDPCGVGQAHEKGRVENAVGYVKKNFLAGLELTDFRLVNPAARQWLDAVTNVRIHGSTHRRPVDLLDAERPQLKPLPSQPYDVGVIRPGRANSQFRVTVDANTYSVPAHYAGAALTLKLYPDHLCFYHQDITPLRASNVAKVWRRQWTSTVRPWASRLAIPAAARSRLNTGRNSRLRLNRLSRPTSAILATCIRNSSARSARSGNVAALPLLAPSTCTYGLLSSKQMSLVVNPNVCKATQFPLDPVRKRSYFILQELERIMPVE